MRKLKYKILALFRNGYNHPNVGRVFYSPYFKNLIIVTYFKSDKNWKFRFAFQSNEFKAESKLSYFIEKNLEVHE